MKPENTIEIKVKDKSRFNVLYFALTIILQIISFSFLFNYRSSEYIVYIFSFLVFCVSPFVWITDLIALGDVLNKNSIYYSLFRYKELSLIISSLLVVSGIFIVILSNEKTRKQKVERKRKADNPEDPTGENPIIDKNNAKLDNLIRTPMYETRSKTILILYTTIIVLMWGMVLETFSTSETFENRKAADYKTGFSTLIAFILDQPYIWLNYTETEWHKYTDQVGISPLLKSLALYCVTFIVTFFGFFMRMPYGVVGLPDDKVRLDKYKIINMGNMFGPVFTRNIGHYRDTAIFFTCLILCVVLYGVLRCLQQIGEGARTIVKFAFIPLVILIFGLFFGLRKTISTDGVQKMIMFLLAFLLSSLGTPVVVGISQMFLEIGGMSLNSPDFFYIKAVIGLLVFLTLFLLSFIYGIKWITEDSFKNLQIMNAILVCMAVSLFIGLTPSYTVFTNIYRLVKFIIESLLVYVVPLLIVILSLVLFIYSFKNRQKGLITDG
jgi:hypothetical protein